MLLKMILSGIISLACLNVAISQKAPKITFEEIRQMCENVPLEKRLRMSVSSFKSATPQASNVFGDELSHMLSNALQNVNCFNILLSQKDIAEITNELEFAESGNVNKSKAPRKGKMLGSQVMVMGKVTEISTGENAISALGLKIGEDIAKLGFIVQLINTETREIVASKSVNVQGNAGGFKGFKIFNTEVAGVFRPFNGNKAVADAMEKGIIKAIEFIAESRNKLPFPVIEESVIVKQYNKSNCKLLQSKNTPKIVIIMPEYHISNKGNDPDLTVKVKSKSSSQTNESKTNGDAQLNLEATGRNRQVQYIFDNTTSGNIITNKLTNAGFEIIDPAFVEENEEALLNASKSSKLAISIAKKANADICIYGTAFSEYSTRNEKQKSCRGKIEFKAIRIKDGVVLASNSMEGTGIDNSELIASKLALKDAAEEAVQFILQKLCE
ncbi:MAG: CsgG/HfaB family protein [Bacteroidota bacterium]|jgi:curli biogenesis system outer membrane secretion channel CsgG